VKLGILIVDPQNDFFPGGALGVDDGDAIVDPINQLLERHAGAPVYITRDWHPADTCHFKARGGPWPPHCVQDSDGAAFHAELNLPEGARVYQKGTDPEDDGGYSGFDGEAVGSGNQLADDLRADGVEALVVAGLATDYCVRATVLDALENGLSVFLLKDGVRAVNLKPDDGDKALKEMQEAGAYLIEPGTGA
jgi:nicotinamidase/pyrazinamidase